MYFAGNALSLPVNLPRRARGARSVVRCRSPERPFRSTVALKSDDQGRVRCIPTS